MTDLSAHFFAEHPVRSLERDGEPWFVIADVCRVLEIQNSRDTAAKVLEDYEKSTTTIYTLGGNQELSIINESGLYSLIFRSRKPAAKAFKRWVTTEVLPAIRKTGRYDPELTHSTAIRRKPPRAVAAPRRREDALRSVQYKGERWWLGADLARLLGVRNTANLRLYTDVDNIVGCFMEACPDLARHFTTSVFEQRIYWIVNDAGRRDILRQIEAVTPILPGDIT